MADNDYVKPPQAVPPEEQLSQLKVAAKGMINSFVDKANQASNDPANQARGKESDEFLQRDINATAQDAATSYTKALTQVGDAFQKLESAGRSMAGAGKETTAGAREQAQQQSKDVQVKVQSGQSALQQGIAKVHDALTSGMAVANEKLQDGAPKTEESKDLNLNHPTTLLQSLGNAIRSTAQSVKDAFVTPSPTANQSHATPTSTNLPVTHPPAQSVSESIGQTAAALRDAITSTWSSETPPPVRPDSTTPKALPPTE